MDRTSGAAGFCQTPVWVDNPRVRYAAATLHFGEEPMPVGRGGSGTVFFTNCNLRCVFCQNYQISQQGLGTEVLCENLAGVFLDLQRRGAENINLVTPTHCIHPILVALEQAYEQGLALPLIYNTNGYEKRDLLRLLDGIVDVYLPDMKYMESSAARRYSSAPDYPETAKAAILEMYRQVGPFEMNDGVARHGLIVRHLVLPDNVAGSYDLLLWLKEEGLTRVPLSLMSQYTPQYRAREFREIDRTVPQKEYIDLVEYACDLGFEHVLAQGLDSQRVYLPDFSRDEPFAPSGE